MVDPVSGGRTRLSVEQARRLPSALGRPPDFVIGEAHDPYLARWWVIPRNRWFNVYLHNIRRDDDDLALHDHPWWSVSFPLTGGLREVRPQGERRLRRFRPYLRRATARHRLVVGSPRVEPGRAGPPPARVWTLFLTGPRLRDWGFHCPQGFVPWWEFTDPDDPGRVGRGCGETDTVIRGDRP